MISEEEKQRYIEASKCKGCLDWHHHCQAECCKIIFLDIDPDKLKCGGRFFSVKISDLRNFVDRRYYQLHDVECVRGLLRFKKSKIITVGRKVMYISPCKLLKDNLCMGHPDKKPELCKMLTLENAKIPEQPFRLTDNCLFKYKCKEVKKNG